MEMISTSKYEVAKPTSNAVSHTNNVVYPENPITTVIKEEWETRKKKEITTTRQIETRVKRQVVLEDGEIIKDSGPLITTNTTEDIEQQEHTTQEKRKNGDDKNQLNKDWEKQNDNRFVKKELNETVIKSREEVEELLETEDRRQFGDITDEAYQQAIQNNHQKDVRLALAESCAKSSLQIPEIRPRIIQHTTKSNKVIDTEKKLERKGLKPNGTIVTETQTSITHEEISDVPDYSESKNDKDTDEQSETVVNECSKKFLKKREEDIVDYVLNGERIARQKHHISEIIEGDQTGNWQPQNIRFPKPADSSENRKDALTEKPLDLEEEDEARKFETFKWLENHFGSESKSPHGSITIDHNIEPITTNTTKQVAANTSFINVTMKSCTPKNRTYKNYSNSSQNQRHHHHIQQQDDNYQSPNPNYENDSYQSGNNQDNNNYQNKNYLNRTKQQENKRSTHSTYQHHQNKSVEGNSTSGRYSDRGYFQGIRDWSERYPSLDKQNNNSDNTCYPSYTIDYSTETPPTIDYNQRHSPLHKQPDNHKNFKDMSYIKTYETSTIGRRQKYRAPSPNSTPIHRSKSSQLNSNQEDKNIHVMENRQVSSSSPIQVIQRTWENRNREMQEHDRIESSSSPDNHHHHRLSMPRFRSASPLIKICLTSTAKREKKNNTEKSDKHGLQPRNYPSKSKISESLKKFVNKLRSASIERKSNKKNGTSSSTSQLEQIDDNNITSYLQYNSIDKNIPEVRKDEISNGRQSERPERPERPPRSPKNSSTVYTASLNNPVTKHLKVTRMNGHVANYDQFGRNNSITPVHRYYIEESVGGKNSHDRSMISNYGTSRKHGKIRKSERDVIDCNNIESGSLGRFSKSASRLATNYDQQDDYNDCNNRQPHQQFTSAQTLPRKLHLSANHSTKSQSTLNRLPSRQPTSIITYPNKRHEIPLISPAKQSMSNQSPRHYGSMINISLKNTLSPTTPIQEDPVRENQSQMTVPNRFNKSSLLRSRSFNVLEGSSPMNEGSRISTQKASYKSNTQLHRLVDESPPLKSPSILASISRSNKDLFKEDH